MAARKINLKRDSIRQCESCQCGYRFSIAKGGWDNGRYCPPCAPTVTKSHITAVQESVSTSECQCKFCTSTEGQKPANNYQCDCRLCLGDKLALENKIKSYERQLELSRKEADKLREQVRNAYMNRGYRKRS